MKPSKEAAFEIDIEGQLLAQDYISAKSKDYDKKRALIPSELWAFIEETQPKAWKKLRDILGDKLEQLFLDEIKKRSSKPNGRIELLRHGLSFYGKEVKLAYFAPAHQKNPQALALYKANRVAVVRQLYYDPNNDNSIDTVLFLNGFPIITVEVKTHTTGQTVENAKKQYCDDRDPEAPIFRFKQGAFAHFAVDPDEAEMTTRLARDNTRFLPFNRGKGTAAGNPSVDGKNRTYYLWEEVWQRDSFLELVERYIHVQRKEETQPDGKKVKKEALIFPRYHQLNAVRKLIASCQEHGAGRNYLIQHSAGSGKSNTIAWLAHQLASLHDADSKRVFHSVVVISDRQVLDQQLQDTIYQFDHAKGVVEKIDENSKQLGEALKTGVPIIISTIHKFGYIEDVVASLPDRRYAVIVDEAHSSQSGEMALDLRESLASSEVQKRVEEEGEGLPEKSLLALRKALLRGPQPNLSFFAFTATPKYKTLEVFGDRDADGKPKPFHLYSMRQAIEEGFILDVLRNYTTYKAYYRLVKRVEEDPELDKRKAARALSRFMRLHPHNVAQKTQVMVEHFRRCTRNKIGGLGKAMVVTSSRLAAVRYFQEFQRYISDNNYTDVRCLVAFSDEVKDDIDSNITYTEAGLNNGIHGRALRESFASQEYNVLLVAEKFQTGFDEPRLHTMYVDKRLSGIQAVQTLSRLNRTCPGKEDTFVLDFANEREEILKSFQDFYETARIDEPVDPQRLYELQSALDATHVYLDSEVELFEGLYFKASKGTQRAQDNPKLNAAVNPAKDRFEELPEDQQDEFRNTLNAFLNLYGFLAQVVPFADHKLERLYAFGRWLASKISKKGAGGGPLKLADEVALEYYRLEETGSGRLGLHSGEGGALKGPHATGIKVSKPETVPLSQVIKVLNDRFGTDFTEAEQLLVDAVMVDLSKDEGLAQSAQANTKENFKFAFDAKLDEAFMERHGKNEEFIDRVFSDKVLGDALRKSMLEALYEHLRKSG